MNEHDRAAIGSVWSRLVGGSLSVESIVARIVHDAGVDISDLTPTSIISLFNGDFQGDWASVGFAFSELLSYYAVFGRLGEPAPKGEETVAWVFAVLSLGDAMEADAADLDLNFNSFLDGLGRHRPRLRIEESSYVVRRFICREGAARYAGEFHPPPPRLTPERMAWIEKEYPQLRLAMALLRRHAKIVDPHQ